MLMDIMASTSFDVSSCGLGPVDLLRDGGISILGVNDLQTESQLGWRRLQSFSLVNIQLIKQGQEAYPVDPDNFHVLRRFLASLERVATERLQLQLLALGHGNLQRETGECRRQTIVGKSCQRLRGGSVALDGDCDGEVVLGVCGCRLWSRAYRRCRSRGSTATPEKVESR